MKKYKVYRITNLSNGRKYIGLTQRENLEERLRAHFNELTRKAKHAKSINPRSLQAAMYEEYEKNKSSWKQVFRIELIKDFDSEQEMRDCESKFIEDENTLAPQGYNLVHGGHSIGGMGRSEVVSIRIIDRNGVCSDLNFSSRKEMYSKLGKKYSISRSTLQWRVEQYIKKYQSNDILSGEILYNAIYYAIFNFSDKRKTVGKNLTRQKNRRCNQNSNLGVDSSFSNKISK